MKEEISIVLFGGTGDLVKRKIVPAIVKLMKEGKFHDISIVGVARSNHTPESYKSLISEFLNDEEKAIIGSADVRYLSADASAKNSLKDLHSLLKKNRIFYLSTSYTIFAGIVKELKSQKLTGNKDNTKLLFEKPFGSDLKSSTALERAIKSGFSEEQIYRIDHYLAKETMQNIVKLKSENSLLENSLNGEQVDEIEIIADESLGVGNRLGYYNDAGAIKDMMQSHLLQVLSLVIMDVPEKLNAASLSKSKVDALKKLVFEKKDQLIGQYEGYKDECEKAGIVYKKTETFARIVLASTSRRWKGTRFILRTGKKLSAKKGQIVIRFKPAEKGNKIVINEFPTQDISIILTTRDPNNEGNSRPVSLDFCHECLFGPNTSDAYATLLWEAAEGNMALFAKSNEIAASWRIIDKMERIKSSFPFIIYGEGSKEVIK